MENSEIPEFDPQEKGIYQGQLRLSFIKAMDKIAYVEVIELIGKTLPLFLEFDFHPSIKFSYLRKHLEHISNDEVPIELREKFRKYVAHFVQWAEKYNVDSDWFLDALHDRFGHIVAADGYYKRQLDFLNYNQLKLLLSEYSEIKNDEYALFLRGELISEIFGILELKNNDFDAEKKLNSIFQFFDGKDEREIIKVENIWKSNHLEKLQSKKAIWIKAAINMSYNYNFVIEVSNSPFIFEFRSWQFNEEKKSNYREEITERFKRELNSYFDEIENYAIENEYKKNEQPKNRGSLNQTDRIYLFILYQVKKMSPDDCLNALQKILGKKIEISSQAVSKTVNELSQHIGFVKRKSKTKTEKKET